MIIAFTGHAGVGKDEAAKILVNEFGFTRIAFADPMRAAVLALNPVVCDCDGRNPERLSDLVCLYGWDEAKRKFPEIRALLQRFGTEVGRNQFGETFWVDLAMRKASQFESVIFTDCRFPNEAEAIRNAGGIVVKIERPGVTAVNAHVSDKGLPADLIDDWILNDDTLEELAKTVRLLPRIYEQVKEGRTIQAAA